MQIQEKLFKNGMAVCGKCQEQNHSDEILYLNHILDQIDLTDIYRTLHLKAAEYTFFPSTYGTISKTDHI
jgi:hypothetical protein